MMNGFWNLYKFEIKQNRKSFLIWFITISIIMILFMCMYPSFKSADYLELVNAKINALPTGVGSAFGLGGVTGINFQNLFFFFSYMAQFYVIALIIYAINLGSNIISKENDGKHIDYLATKPIKKSSIILAKYSSLISFIALITVSLFIVGCITILIFNKSGSSFLVEMIRLNIKILVMYIFFGTLAFCVSAISKKTSKSSLIIISVFFVSYLFGIASQLVDKLSWLKYFSPYFIFQTSKAGYDFSTKDWAYLSALILISLLLVFLALYKYSKKDLSL